MDLNGVLNAAFDPATGRLRLTAVSGSATDDDDTGEANGVLADVYDAATQSLRVVEV